MGGLMTSLDFLRPEPTADTSRLPDRNRQICQVIYVTLPFVNLLNQELPRTAYFWGTCFAKMQNQCVFFLFEEEAVLSLHYVFLALSPLTNGDVASPTYAPRQSRHGRTNFVILERHLEHGVPPGVQILHLEVH